MTCKCSRAHNIRRNSRHYSRLLSGAPQSVLRNRTKKMINAARVADIPPCFHVATPPQNVSDAKHRHPACSAPPSRRPARTVQKLRVELRTNRSRPSLPPWLRDDAWGCFTNRRLGRRPLFCCDPCHDSHTLTNKPAYCLFLHDQLLLPTPVTTRHCTITKL